MMNITNNKSGPIFLSCVVPKRAKKQHTKRVMPGANLIHDPAWEDVIVKDPDFKGWTTQKTLSATSHHLDENPKNKMTVLEVTVFDGKKVDPNAGESPYRMIPLKAFQTVISDLGDMKLLQDIQAKDARPEIQNTARLRIEEIMKPPEKTENLT